MNAWMNFAAAWLLDFGLLASVLLAALAIGRWLCRSPGQRMALAWGTWLGLLLLAALTALPQWPRRELTTILRPRVLPGTQLTRGSASSALLTDVELLLRERGGSLGVAGSQGGPWEPVAAPRATTAWNWPGLLVAGWLFAAGLALAWIALGLAQTWRLVAHSAAAPAWVARELERLVSKRRRKPRALTSTRLSSAVAIGAIRPKILLPQAGVEETNAPAVRAALAHEWAHIRHGDLWLLAIERLLVPLLAWHPLFWWLRRSVRLDQELLADAAAAGDEPVEYAEALLTWAKTARPAPAGLAAMSLWESPHTLSRRVAMLLDSNRPATQCLSRRWQVAFVLLAAAFVCGLSLVTLRTLVADEEQPKTVVLVAEPILNSPEAIVAAQPLPVEANEIIVLQSVVLEADKVALEGILEGGDDTKAVFSHPEPRIEVRLRESEALRTSLEDGPTIRILSRPKFTTLDGQLAKVQVASGEGHPHVQPGELGLSLEVTPRLILKSQGKTVGLRIDLRQSQLAEPTAGGLPAINKRALSLSVEVPLGKSVVIAQRPAEIERAEQPTAEKALVLVLEPQVIQEPGKSADQAAASARSAPARREIHQRLAELNGQLDRLGNGPGGQREAAEIRQSLMRLRREIDRLIGPGEPTTQAQVYKVKGNTAAVAKEVNDRLKERKIAGVTVNVDSKSNSLLVVSSTETPYTVIQDVITQIVQATKDEPPPNISLKAADPKPDADVDSRPPANYHPITGEYPVTGDAKKLAKLVEERFKAEKIENAGVSADPKSRLIVSAPGYDDARIRKIIAAVEAEQAPPTAANDSAAKGAEWKDWISKGKPKAGEASANDLGRQAERETQLKLMKLDMEDAVLARDVAKADLEREMEIQKRSPAAISEAELRKHKFQVDRAEIQIRRLQIMLEGLEKPVVPPGPISR